MLKGKTVLLGVTGSIAAYKIAYLASALKKLHADVHVLMTKNATNFINPITFESLTGNKCLVDTFDRNFQFQVEHVSIAKKADVVMIAPASANENQEDACSIVRHVPLGSVNLGKISALNQLARDICEHKISLIDSWEELERCQNLPNYPNSLLVFFCGLGSAGFCYLFGGSALDSLFTFGIGILEQLLLFALKKYKFSKIITNIFASLFVTLLAMLCMLTNLNLLQDKIIIGAIMPLVPGIAFTTAIRDIYNADYLSGTIHLLDALITAICIAVGACLPFVIMNYFGGL